MTFNLVPSLLEQLDDYAAGVAMDRDLALSRQESWSAEEQAQLLSAFFQVNTEPCWTGIRLIGRLFRLRKAVDGPDRVCSREAFYRDLVAWFNLAWIDFGRIGKDDALQALVRERTRLLRSKTYA